MRIAGIFLPDVQDRRAAQASRAQEAGEVAADERDPRWCGSPTDETARLLPFRRLFRRGQ
jgi:hypothetical protein